MAERGKARPTVIQRLRRTANTVPGVAVFFQNIQNIRSVARISKSEYQYTLQSSDTETLYRVAPQMQATVAARSKACATSPPTSTSRIRR